MMRPEHGPDSFHPTHGHAGPAHDVAHGEHVHHDGHEHEAIDDWEHAWIDLGGEG
ncbi:MAG: hypothetical protein AB7K24_27100 [Gemmataceae bacterium]